MTTTHEQPHNEEDKFVRDLVRQYPGIWPQDDAGLPTEPQCGVSCPEGWRPLVDGLCAALQAQTTGTISVRNKSLVKRLQVLAFNKLWKPVHSILWNLLDPYAADRPKDARTWCIPKDVQERVKKSRKYDWQKSLSVLTFQKLNPRDQYLQIPDCPYVKIAQIKEKFGTLRVYVDGGNDRTHDMIRAAEYISSRTCAYTGKRGTMHVKRGWYLVVSEEEGKRLGYVKCKDDQI